MNVSKDMQPRSYTPELLQQILISPSSNVEMESRCTVSYQDVDIVANLSSEGIDTFLILKRPVPMLPRGRMSTDYDLSSV